MNNTVQVSLRDYSRDTEMLNNYLLSLSRKRQTPKYPFAAFPPGYFRSSDILTRLRSTIITRVEAHRIDYIPRKVRRGIRTRAFSAKWERESAYGGMFRALLTRHYRSRYIQRRKYNISGRRSIRRSPGRGTGLPLCFSSAARVVSGQGGPRGGLGVHHRIPSRFSQLTYRFLAGCLA